MPHGAEYATNDTILFKQEGELFKQIKTDSGLIIGFACSKVDSDAWVVLGESQLKAHLNTYRTRAEKSPTTANKAGTIKWAWALSMCGQKTEVPISHLKAITA